MRMRRRAGEVRWSRECLVYSDTVEVVNKECEVAIERCPTCCCVVVVVEPASRLWLRLIDVKA